MLNYQRIPSLQWWIQVFFGTSQVGFFSLKKTCSSGIRWFFPICLPESSDIPISYPQMYIYIYNIYIICIYINIYYIIYIYIQIIPQYEYPIISISFLLYKANPQFPHGAFQYFVPIPQMTGKYSSNMEHMGMMLFKQRNRSLSSHVIPHLPIFLDQYPLVI